MDIDEAKKLILNSEINLPEKLEDGFDDENEEPARNKQLAHNPESSEVVFKLIGESMGLTYDLNELILPI